MIRGLLLLALLGACTPAWAGKVLTVRCRGCKYAKRLNVGPTKGEAAIGLDRGVFYCQPAKQFMSFELRSSTTQMDKLNPKVKYNFATQTEAAAGPGSSFFLYSHSSCERALIPLDYYLSPKAPACPVCGQGKVEVETTGFFD